MVIDLAKLKCKLVSIYAVDTEAAGAADNADDAHAYDEAQQPPCQPSTSAPREEPQSF